MDVEIYGKRLELLKQAVPSLRRAGVLVSGRQPLGVLDSQWARNFEAAADSIDGLDLGLGRDFGRDQRAWHACLACAAGHALRHVSGLGI